MGTGTLSTWRENLEERGALHRPPGPEAQGARAVPTEGQEADTPVSLSNRLPATCWESQH